MDDILNVTESNFELEVIDYSHNIPVLVDFWATWCQPCRQLSPVLEKLAVEGSGNFRLAKVDVDGSKNLAVRYGVLTIPTVKVFYKGQLAGGFSGLQPEKKVREFLRSVVRGPVDLAVEKGDSLLASHKWRQAEQTFREALTESPSDTRAMLGLVTSLLGQGLAMEALGMIDAFPASHEYTLAMNLQPLAIVFSELEKVDPSDIDDLEQAFRQSVRIAGKGNLEAGVDGLLEVLRKDKRHRNGQTRQVVVALLQLLGDGHPDIRAYRAELSSILF